MQAQNAIQAVRYAKTNFAVDTSNVFVIGHSQGGWHAQIVASKYPNEVKGVISLAGPATSVFEQDVQTYVSVYLCQGLDSNLALQKAVLKTYKEHSNPVSDTSTNKGRLHSRIIQGYEPWDVISNIKTPFLFVFGENDEFVFANRSVERISEMFDGNIPAYIKTLIIPGADHSFRVAEKCYSGSTKTLPFSEKLKEEMYKWLMHQAKKSK